MQQQARQIRQKAHFGTLITDYRSGKQGFRDAEAAYNKARRLARGGAVWFVGISAGGHIALRIAERKEVDCVVTEGAPTKPENLKDFAGALAAETFAPGQTDPDDISAAEEQWLVLNRAADLPPTLAGQLKTDQIVSAQQAHLLDGISQVDVEIMPPGTANFTHGLVHRGALSRFRKKTINLMRRVSGQPPLARNL